MLEEEVGSELQSQPFFELDDQIHRVRRIEAQPGEFDVQLDLCEREVERACQILHTPVADRGLAGVIWTQQNPLVATRGITRMKPSSLTAPHSAGQGLLGTEHDARRFGGGG